MIQAIRTIRSEMGISPAKRIPLLIKHPTEQCQTLIQRSQTLLVAMSKLSSVDFLTEDALVPASAIAVVDSIEYLIPIAGLIDQKAELERLTREISKLDKDIAVSESKLNNDNFVAKAPPEVITKEKERLQLAQEARMKLDNQRKQVGG